MWNSLLGKQFGFSDRQFSLKAIFQVQILNFRSWILSWVLQLFLKKFSFYQEKGLICIKATFTPIYTQSLFPPKIPLCGKSIDQGIKTVSIMNAEHKMQPCAHYRTYQNNFTQFLETISVSVPFIAISQKITSILYRPNLRVYPTVMSWNTCTAKMLWILKEEDSKVPWENNPCSIGAARQPSSSKHCNQACFDINSHNPHEKEPDKNKITWE